MSETLDQFDAEAVIAVFDRGNEAMLDSRYREKSIVRLPGQGRLLVTGDLHDNTIHLQKILHLAKLQNAPDHHVILHELIHGDKLLNGMDFSHRMLTKVALLVLDHPDQVHPLLANHELSQLTGRGVSKGAGNSLDLFNQALEYVYQDAWQRVADAINRFIRAMPLALISDSGILCAHSLPASKALMKFDTDIINRDLKNEDYRYPYGSAYLMVWGRAHDQVLYETLAKKWNVKLFYLGHHHVETGIESKGFSPGVIVLNSDHERATVVDLDLAATPDPEEALLTAIPLVSVQIDPSR